MPNSAHRSWMAASMPFFLAWLFAVASLRDSPRVISGSRAPSGLWNTSWRRER